MPKKKIDEFDDYKSDSKYLIVAEIVRYIPEPVIVKDGKKLENIKELAKKISSDNKIQSDIDKIINKSK